MNEGFIFLLLAATLLMEVGWILLWDSIDIESFYKFFIAVSFLIPILLAGALA